jgi:hypothetical protein
MPSQPYPVSEYIRQNVFATLQSITKANGYHVDLNVEEAARLGNSQTNNTAVLHVGDPQLISAQQSQCIEWYATYVIVLFVVQSEGVGSAIDTPIEIQKADVEKAMMQDPHRGVWPGDGSQLAHDTLIHPTAYFEKVKGANAGNAVEVWVRYRTAIDDPYVKR